MKTDYKLALGSLDELEKGAMRQAMILDDREGGHWESEEVQDHYLDVKSALEQADKEHKALEIIKEKKVNVHLLMLSGWLKEYNSYGYRSLTQEEYKLLKEVLGKWED